MSCRPARRLFASPLAFGLAALAAAAAGGALAPRAAHADDAALARDAPGARVLANPGWSAAKQYKHYLRVAAAFGAEVDVKPGARTVIGLRGIDPERNLHAEAERAFRTYTDTFVVLWRDDEGRPHVEHFRGSTTPGQAETSYEGTPDANGDGEKDIAHLQPGIFEYRARTYKGKSAYGNGVRVPCFRDTSHDGRIDVAEMRASLERGDTADGILFHRGSDTRPSSVGCQTLTPAVFEAFEAALGDAGRFTYLLVDARISLEVQKRIRP